MTFYDWATLGLMMLGEAGAVFAWVWMQAKVARTETQGKIDALSLSNATSMYNLKKDVLEKIVAERDALHERCDKLERDHQTGRTEFTQELREITSTFTRTCENIQAKLEHLTSTIIGQYVPRSEIDGRFSSIGEKTDRVIQMLYDMKK